MAGDGQSSEGNFAGDSLSSEIDALGDLVAGNQQLPLVNATAVPRFEAEPGSSIVSGKETNGKNVEGYLTSLDIELPSRGVDYFFSSPRGDPLVTVRPMVTRTFTNLTSALILLGICFGVWLAVWLANRVNRSATLKVIAIGALVIGGLISVVSMTLPIYGLLAIFAAIVLSIHWVSSPVTVTV